MTDLETLPRRTDGLVSVYDDRAYSDQDFQRVLDDVHHATEIERTWISGAGLEPYPSDEAILDDASAGRLVRVGAGVGYIAREYLTAWSLERSDPEHKYHYSPPFLGIEAFEVLEDIAQLWQEELGPSRSLSVTSLVRSAPYQTRLGTQTRKLTINEKGKLSSHQVAIAFDIDACGIKEADDQGNIRSINPRFPGFKPGLVRESRMLVRSLLLDRKADGLLNFVEELPGTQEHCFHVAVKPSELR